MKPTTKCSLVAALLSGLLISAAFAQSKTDPVNKFAQMDDLLPTPNEQRTASGAPGNRYWQQRADYDIKVELDDINQRLTASETITYHNNSPDSLSYLWLQLDQNIWAKDSEGLATETAPDFKKLPLSTIEALIAEREF
ncbi:MAG TPA: hypothetical protein VEW46_25765, partial [Pyrinomonadaceae bacterium]|nr:hypothetical protein [Pyrinomonadaceae bacterium]